VVASRVSHQRCQKGAATCSELGQAPPTLRYEAVYWALDSSAKSTARKQLSSVQVDDSEAKLQHAEST
jgi:hypothetical protein